MNTTEVLNGSQRNIGTYLACQGTSNFPLAGSIELPEYFGGNTRNSRTINGHWHSVMRNGALEFHFHSSTGVGVAPIQVVNASTSNGWHGFIFTFYHKKMEQNKVDFHEWNSTHKKVFEDASGQYEVSVSQDVIDYNGQKYSPERFKKDINFRRRTLEKYEIEFNKIKNA